MSGGPRAAYQARLLAAQQEIAALDRRSAFFANLRTVTFLAALAAAGLAVAGKAPAWAYGLAGAAALAYVALAIRHARVIAAEGRARVRAQLNERGLSRLDGRWRAFPAKGEAYATAEHLYAPDLDLFGQASLFQLLDETATQGGEARLAAILAAPASAAAVLERQGALRELSALLDFRQSLRVVAGTAAEKKADARCFIAWAENGAGLSRVRWVRPLAWALPLLTALLFTLEQLSVLGGPFFALPLALQLLAALLTRRAFGATYDAIAAGEQGFVRFEETFAAIEAQRFEHPLLEQLRRGLEADGPAVSARLRRFGRLFAFAEARQSAQLYVVLQLLTLWDAHWHFALERWRLREGRRVRAWFEALHELEALCALAGLAHDRPDYAWPQVVPGPACFEALGLGHPLLDQPVRNDVRLPGSGRALLVTGSNMSGKTTLLRAVGVNAVMALAGLPVCATSLRMSEVCVLTSMRVKDSLERGVSYFYAEVQRMKALLDAATAHPGQGLFLLDELLMGTNTRERQIASKELLRLLCATGATGAVTTHDLSLSQAEELVENVHFRDLITDGKMTFDYRLQPGVVQTTNALRVLRDAGLPIG